MYAVNNSSRALLVALVPLAALHAVLLAMALLATQATPQDAGLPLQEISQPAPDRILILYVVRLAQDAALLFAGHLLLRRSAIYSRMAYALMGGVAAALGYMIAIREGLLLFPPGSGTEITSGLLPTVAGAIAGFLYGQFAFISRVESPSQPSQGDSRVSKTFEGPLRVRTSVAAVAIAATMPAALTAVLSLGLVSLFLPAPLIAGNPSVFTMAIPAQLFLTLLVATIVPSAIFILATHHVARAINRTRGLEYAAIGSATAAACAVVVAPFMPITSVVYLIMPALVYGAIMGALYRRFAGIEPLPLPEVVLVSDERSLVGVDHPSRRQHDVIITG